MLQDVFGLSAGAYSVGLRRQRARPRRWSGQVNARLLDRFTPRRLLITGLVIAVAGGALLTVSAAAGSLPGVLAGLFVSTSTIGTDDAQRHWRWRWTGTRNRAGTAAALLGFAQAVIASLRRRRWSGSAARAARCR